MPTHFLDTVPIWLLYLGLGLLFWAAVQGGYVLGERRQRSAEHVDEGRSAHAGIVLGAMLGLTAFMLGFTYSMAGKHFDSRRQLVIDDVNAIGRSFQRTEYIPEPQRTTSRKLFSEYVARRNTLFVKSHETQLERAEQIQQRLLAEASPVAREAPTPVTALYLQSLNELIDLHDRRVYVEFWVRIPKMVIGTLAVLSILMMFLTGYLQGLRARRYGLPTGVMIFTYATVFLLVIDLDRPAKGLFYVRQDPMLELRAIIQRETTDDPRGSLTPGQKQ